MELFETLFLIDLILMILMLLWKIKSVWETVDANSNLSTLQKKDKHLFNWLFFILNVIAFGIGFFTYLTNNTELLLTPLINLMGIIFILNVVLFLAEMFFILQWKAEEVIEAHNTLQQRKDLKSTL